MNDAVKYVWNDLESDAPMPMLSRRRIVGDNVMLSEIRLDQGCFVPMHTHVNEQIACVTSGRMRFRIGTSGSDEDREVIVTAGEVLHLPSNVPHSAEAIEDSVVLDVFYPISDATGIDQTHDD